MLKPKRYDKIVSTFTKTIKELEVLVQSNELENEKTLEKIEDLTHKSNMLSDESSKAEKLKEKLVDLVG